MPFPTSIDDMWAQALQRGLFPLSIAHNSKAPIGEGWNVLTTPVKYPNAGGVGFRTGDGGFSGFDVDQLDEAISARLLWAFRSILGDGIPVRWGRRPKFLIPYYLLDAPVQGRSFRFPQGGQLQLIGGQFVAYGPHKDTGLPYEWENWDNWHLVPRLTKAQVEYLLAEVPRLAGTSLQFFSEHEVASKEELDEAVPRNTDEWETGRVQAQKYMGLLKQELMGKTENRGSTIFSLVGVLKYAEMHQMCTREEIEGAITSSGQSLSEGRGGRLLGEEITRHDQLPVLRGNLIMGAILARRTMMQGLHQAIAAPVTIDVRSGFEIKLEDDTNELPWLLYQRVLCGEVHFFTGHSGAGKSTVVTDLAVSYLKGSPWLDADIERTDGHVLWIAAEDDYGTERRVRHLLRQEPNGRELANRFHLVRGVPEPMAFEQQCVAQIVAMAQMGMRVDLLVLDTWGASGLCFADNDTESVLKAMFIIKSIIRRTQVAVLLTDHLPLNSEDAWQKGNGAKSGNSGFMYRVTVGKNDMVSIDCGKARGAPKAKSYIGKVVSENYGQDSKGRTTTVNVFKREMPQTKEQAEQTAIMRLAAMLPGVTAEGMAALRSGSVVTFASVAAELGSGIKGEAPGYVITKDAAAKMFSRDAMAALLNSGHFRTIHGVPFIAVYAPAAAQQKALVMPFTIKLPERMPWD